MKEKKAYFRRSRFRIRYKTAFAFIPYKNHEYMETIRPNHSLSGEEKIHEVQIKELKRSEFQQPIDSINSLDVKRGKKKIEISKTVNLHTEEKKNE